MLGVEHLDRHVDVEEQAVRPPHRPHSPLAEEADDPVVVGEDLARDAPPMGWDAGVWGAGHEEPRAFHGEGAARIQGIEVRVFHGRARPWHDTSHCRNRSPRRVDHGLGWTS
jgi:hypothetical protein